MAQHVTLSQDAEGDQRRFAQDTFEEIRRRYYGEVATLSREGMARKAESGDYPGPAPTGYWNVRRLGRAWIDIDPVMAPLVVEAFHLAAEGALSVRAILAELTPKGLRSRNGVVMNAPALRGLLRNPFYAGFVRYQGKLYAGNHELLVSRELFERVQRSLTSRRRR